MNRIEKRRASLVKQMQQLADAKVNDCVKLAYLKEEEMDLVDGLDLTALTEFKRSSSGVVEIKFHDRSKVLEQLLSLTTEPGEHPMEKAMRALALPGGEG